MNTPTLQWELVDAINVVRLFNVHALPLGYAVGLTGGVLFRGYSNNDLDIIIYPLRDVRHNYQSVVEMIYDLVCGTALYQLEHSPKDKLVFVVVGKDKRRIEIFIPSVKAEGRFDTIEAVNAPKDWKSWRG